MREMVNYFLEVERGLSALFYRLLKAPQSLPLSLGPRLTGSSEDLKSEYPKTSERAVGNSEVVKRLAARRTGDQAIGSSQSVFGGWNMFLDRKGGSDRNAFYRCSGLLTEGVSLGHMLRNSH